MRFIMRPAQNNFNLMIDICTHQKLSRYINVLVDAFRNDNFYRLKFAPSNLDIDGNYIVQDGKLVPEVDKLVEAVNNLPEESQSLMSDTIVIHCDAIKKNISVSWEAIYFAE